MLKSFSIPRYTYGRYQHIILSLQYRTKTTTILDKKRYRKLLKEQDVKNTMEEVKVKSIAPTFKEYEYGGNTIPGNKKDTSIPLPRSYSPVFVEKYWYDWWKESGFFSPKPRHSVHGTSGQKDVFSMVIPPPNVTGRLHLGHALTTALEDTIVRWQRMLGKEVLWLPGCDHAGIATQMVVERQMDDTYGKTRKEMGREKFLQAIWNWKNDKGTDIFSQLQRLGASLDWDRKVFTLDKNYAYAVEEAFIRLHQDGIIYRDECCVNWSCHLQSTLSDLEVESRVLDQPTVLSVPGYQVPIQFGLMHKFAYELSDPVGDIKEIVVATTRLETMLADAAVAVHPDDARYSALIGQFVKHPFRKSRFIPIIADEAVDKDLGTGALKITPAHDFTDFEIGKRHNLALESCINADGTMLCLQLLEEQDNRLYKKLHKMPRFIAREDILDSLIKANLYRGSQSHSSILRVCSRTGDVVEPMVKKQWFVRIADLAKEALVAVESGKIKMVQNDMFIKQWQNWLNTTGDWCISRQIWWGHRIPAYNCTNLKTSESVWVSAHNQDDALQTAVTELSAISYNDIQIQRDDDVLDTWFSSSLYPFASLGWPQKTDDMKKFYPLSLMETGSDLIFFWVARMTMLGLRLTGKAPFEKVLFHPMVRDRHGRKMSKSVGNVIDPLDVIDGTSFKHRLENLKEFDDDDDDKTMIKDHTYFHGGEMQKCGSDALRLSLCAHSTESQNIKFKPSETIASRKLCNKIWNVFRFIDKHFSSEEVLNKLQARKLNRENATDNLKTIDLWARSQLAHAVESCNDSLTQYNIPVALQAVSHMWRSVLSEIYIRYCSSLLGKQLQDKNDGMVLSSDYEVDVALNVLELVETSLRLLSPFAPYLTEELWQRLPKDLVSLEDVPKSICIASYPTSHTHKEKNIKSDKDMQMIISAVDHIRQQAVIGRMKSSCPVVIVCEDEEKLDVLLKNAELVQILTGYPVECHSKNDIGQLTLECAGIVDEESDVTILFRFSHETLREYIYQDEKMKLYESARDVWMKTVGKLEKRVNETVNPSTRADYLQQILKASESYLKRERFKESLERVRNNFQI